MADTKLTDDRPALPPAPSAHEPGSPQEGGVWELTPWQPWQPWLRYVWRPLDIQPATDTPATVRLSD